MAGSPVVGGVVPGLALVVEDTASTVAGTGDELVEARSPLLPHVASSVSETSNADACAGRRVVSTLDSVRQRDRTTNGAEQVGPNVPWSD